jgi:pathogenesis-related protein 1
VEKVISKEDNLIRAAAMRLLTFILLMIISTARAQTVPNHTGSNATPAEALAALDHHNKVRNDVGVPPLTWSPELAAFAQAWADHLAHDKGCDMQHRPRSGQWQQKYGENIFWGMGARYTLLSASTSWYSEIKDYKHGPISDVNWPVAGHYTQMVWSTTTEVGFGVATCRDGATIIVANYSPSGNYWGQKAY